MVGRALLIVCGGLVSDGRGRGIAFFIPFTWNGTSMVKMFQSFWAALFPFFLAREGRFFMGLSICAP